MEDHGGFGRSSDLQTPSSPSLGICCTSQFRVPFEIHVQETLRFCSSLHGIRVCSLQMNRVQMPFFVRVLLFLRGFDILYHDFQNGLAAGQ